MQLARHHPIQAAGTSGIQQQKCVAAAGPQDASQACFTGSQSGRTRPAALSQVEPDQQLAKPRTNTSSRQHT